MAIYRTALVTGGNRGIGLEVCRALAKTGTRVVLTSRSPAAGREAADALKAEGLDVRCETLDVSFDGSVSRCAETLGKDGVSVDILVNNAAVSLGNSLLGGPQAALEETLAVNFMGAVRVCRAFVPGMLKRGYGRIVNVSSGCGSFAEGLPGPAAAYSISKTALNAFTLKLAQEARGDVKINAVCPGWVRTRMGGPAAPRGVEQGADSVVWLATLDSNGPNGGFFRDRQPIPW